MDHKETVARLLDRSTIQELIARYCISADSRDFESFRSVFHPDALTIHGAYRGPSLAFADHAEAFLPLFKVTHHLLGTQSILFESGDVANAETYFTAYHQLDMDAPPHPRLPIRKPGVDEIWWVGGRYVDRFERRNGEWKIARRIGLHDWEHWETADRRGFSPLLRPPELSH